MRSNPLIMTVMGNPGRQYRPNPFVLVDSGSLKIIRNWKGSMMDRKPWEWAQEAARRLDRDVYVVAHPYVPAGFKAGVEVSPLFFAGGPFQVVSSDGSSRQGDLTDIRQPNPSFGASMVGSLVGGMMANALSNPRGPSQPDEHAARELELYVSNDSQLYHSQFIPIVKNLMKRRANGTYDHEKAAKLFLYLADAGAKKYYKEFSTSDSSFRFDLATRWAVAKSLRDSFETEAELGNYDKLAFGVSNNPSGNPLTSREAAQILREAREELRYGQGFVPGFTRSESAGQGMAMAKVVRKYGPRRARRAASKVSDRAQRVAGTPFSNNPVSNGHCKMCGARGVEEGPYYTVRSKRAGWVRGKQICARCYSGMRQLVRDKNWTPRSNPGPKHLRGQRKVTMPIERFARIVKAQKDPALWRDFVAKCKGYHKWSHGSWPTKVTVEAIKKPGMKGIWIAYDMGKEPEKTYIMPKGTKRKGAWKHPWEKMPSLKGDPEAGIILTKMVAGNKMTDFLHGN